jgi:hypothetical protein
MSFGFFNGAGGLNCGLEGFGACTLLKVSPYLRLEPPRGESMALTNAGSSMFSAAAAGGSLNTGTFFFFFCLPLSSAGACCTTTAAWSFSFSSSELAGSRSTSGVGCRVMRVSAFRGFVMGFFLDSCVDGGGA